MGNSQRSAAGSSDTVRCTTVMSPSCELTAFGGLARCKGVARRQSMAIERGSLPAANGEWLTAVITPVVGSTAYTEMSLELSLAT